MALGPKDTLGSRPARIAIAIGSHLAFLALWQIAVVVLEVPDYIIATPLAALQAFEEPNYNFLHHGWATTMEIFGGYAIALVVGVGLAVLFNWSRFLNAALMPLVVTLNMVPKIALAPLFIVWLSYGVVPNMIIAFTICFFPILLTTARGLKEVEPELIDLVRSLRATRWQIFMKIQLPGSLPYIFSGMKVAAVLAVAGAIVGEFIAADRGLGYFLIVAQESLDTAAMLLAIVLISLIGTGLYAIVLLLEHLFVVKDARVE
jgi:NitT/TauT family transport system permease protein